MKRKILIIDDDVDLCLLLDRFLSSKGYQTESVHTGKKGIARYREGGIDVVICDYRLGDMDGKDVLKGIKAENPNAIVLIITGYSDIKTAVDVIKAGAFDYIVKPLIPDEVINVLTKSLSAPVDTPAAILPAQSEKAGKPRSTEPDSEFLEGKDALTQQLYDQIRLVAPTHYSIILYGESGTGKEVIARTIHNQSTRSKKPFVALDCGTISRELAGSELFGHIKGLSQAL
jgi:two-component system response regulator HydG